MLFGREVHPKRAGSGAVRATRIDVADRRTISLMAIAALTAIVVLVVDHYNPVRDLLIILSSGTLVIVVALLFGLSLAVNRTRARAAEIEAIRSASVEAASYGVITTDSEGVVLEWNKAATGIFGFDRSDAIGKNSFDLIVPQSERDEYRTDLSDYADGTSEAGLGEYYEVQLKDALRRVFPVEISVTRIPSDPPMFTMFARSLTQRRIREEENRRLADIVRSSEDSVISVDLHGRITSWNRGAVSLYGYADHEALTKRLSDLTFPDDSHELGSLFRRVMNGVSGEITSERRNKKGKALWVKSRAFPIKDVEGGIAGMSLISRDVTEKQHRAETVEVQRESEHWQNQVE